MNFFIFASCELLNEIYKFTSLCHSPSNMVTATYPTSQKNPNESFDSFEP